MILTSEDSPEQRFGLGQVVSAMHRMGTTTERRALWDVCCAGRVVELDLRGGHAYYRVEGPRIHWHPEFEVFEGDAAAVAVNRLNRAALGATSVDLPARPDRSSGATGA